MVNPTGALASRGGERETAYLSQVETGGFCSIVIVPGKVERERNT